MRKVFFFLMACALTVSSAFAETFNKVTDVSQLSDGAKVLLGNADAGKVSANFASTKKFIDATDATFADGKATLDGPTVMTLKQSGEYWKLFIGTKPVGHKKDNLDLDTKQATETEYEISFNANGTVNIVSQTNDTYFFAYNSSNPRFKVYTSSSNMKSIELYLLDESTVEEQKPTGVTLDKNALEIRLGDAPVALKATVEPAEAVDKSVVWGSLNEAVATVADGTVTAVALGTTKVWVRTNTAEKTDTCVVTVLPALNTTKATYKIVQKADYLPEDAKVFFGTLKNGEDFVMARYERGTGSNPADNIKVADATYGEARHSVEAELQYAYTVKRDGDHFVFVDQDGYYLRVFGSKKLRKSDILDDNAKWIIGEFNADDATVTIKNVGNSQYLLYNHSSNLFNVYDGTSSNISDVVLFSSEALDWVEREKHPSMSVDVTTLDWGEVEEENHTWGTTLMSFNLTFADLSDDIEISLDPDGDDVFELPISGDVISKDSKSPTKYNVFFTPLAVGEYSSKLILHTETAGVDDIEILLVAKAVEEGGSGGGSDAPEFSATVSSILLNPAWNSSIYAYEEFWFTFSAKNLAKKLNLKWERNTTQPWFLYGDEYMFMRLWDGDDFEDLHENDTKDLGTADIKELEIQIGVYAYNVAEYHTQLHFTSLKADSKTDYAIDEIIPITIKVTEKTISSAIETLDANASAQKLLRDGQIVIMRNGVLYGIDGKQL